VELDPTLLIFFSVYHSGLLLGLGGMFLRVFLFNLKFHRRRSVCLLHMQEYGA
jgi:hypothetical protein